MRTISLKLPDALVAELEAAAARRRVTKSRIIRESIEKALHTPSRTASCFDLARDLVGVVKGLPADLATNPGYMDEFGM